MKKILMFTAALLLPVICKASMTWTVYVTTNTQDVEHSQTTIDVSTAGPEGVMFTPAGASFSCAVTNTTEKQLAPGIVLDVRQYACFLNDQFAVANVSGCLEKDNDGGLSQLIILEKGHEYLISLGCSNLANEGKKRNEK